MKLCDKTKTANCPGIGLIIALFLTTIAGFGLFAAETKQKNSATVKTNTPPPQPIVVEIPKSIFIWNPKEPGYGRDPFFPAEPSFVKATEQKNKTTEAKLPDDKKMPSAAKTVISLKLQGVVGNSKCIINGKQISIGDEEMMPYSNGKVRVRCNKIEDEIAHITIIYDDGTTENRELSLKAEK